MGYDKHPEGWRMWAIEIGGSLVICATLYLLGKVFNID